MKSLFNQNHFNTRTYPILFYDKRKIPTRTLNKISTEYGDMTVKLYNETPYTAIFYQN